MIFSVMSAYIFAAIYCLSDQIVSNAAIEYLWAL